MPMNNDIEIEDNNYEVLPFIVITHPWDIGIPRLNEFEKLIAIAVEQRKNMSEEERLEDDRKNKELTQILMKSSTNQK